MRIAVLATILVLALCSWSLQAGPARADDGVRKETRVDRIEGRFGLTGAGVIIAILDRGIDYEHPDFRNDDGTTRILYLYDLTDDTGAAASDHPTGVGTVYTKAEIDAALRSGSRLATRDAVGHGTTTAGLAGGNGRAGGGQYTGMAPEASFIIVKFVTEAVPAHDGEPAQAGFFQPDLFPTALDFVLAKADEQGLPVVVLANFGSVGTLADGTSSFARDIDARFGPGRPGRVFVTGTSDDGGMPNHAAGEIGAGETIDLRFHKGEAGNLRLEFWYDGADRLDAGVVTPTGTFGPYAAPATNGQRDYRETTGFRYTHNGSDVDFWGVTSNKREILIDVSGPPGDYVLRLFGAFLEDGRFHAWLNPARIGSESRFETYVVPGYSLHHGAAAVHNIAPNSYVLRHAWTDVNGVRRSVADEGAVGDLWVGSGIGPTTDGRVGVTVSAPGERLFAPYAPRSYFATFRHNVVRDDGRGGMYGIQSAVSAAAPVTTGIVALMLEADPTLDAAAVKDILQRTARQDVFTGAVPNAAWGYGKIDALAAVAAVLGEPANRAPTAPAVVTPADGAEVVVGGAAGEAPRDPGTPFEITWHAADDPDAYPLTYTWQLAAGAAFDESTVLLSESTGAETRFETTLGALAALLDAEGLAAGSTTLYHRVVVSDGIDEVAGPVAAVQFVRGTLVAAEADVAAPRHAALHAAFPDPFNPVTTIRYVLPEAGRVRLAVYDVLGREVAVLVDERQATGPYEVQWEASGLPGGRYYYRIEAGVFRQTRGVTLLK